MNRARMEQRVIQAAEKAVSDHQYVSAVDVLLGMGSLHPNDLQDWKKGKIHFLEKAVQGSLNKISYAMKCFRRWACKKGLKPSRTEYFVKTSGSKRELRFSKNGDPQIESAYRIHYVSPLLAEQKKQRVQQESDLETL